MLVWFCVGASAVRGVTRPVTAEDLVKLWTYEVAVSPAGKTLVAAARGEERILTLDGAPLSVPGKNPGAFVWSPDGSRFAYLATDDGKRSLFVSNIGKVCDAGRSNAYLAHQGAWMAWSPDGAAIAFTGTLEPVPPAADPIVITRILYKTRTALSDNRRSHIQLVNVAEGVTARAITSGDFAEHSIAWGSGPAAGEIVFLSNRERDPDANLNYDIYAVNTANGVIRQITKTAGVEMSPSISPDGRSVAYAATARRLTTIDSVAEDTHIWMIPFSGSGTPRELNRAQDRRSSSPHWSNDSAHVYYLAGDRGRTSVYRLNAAKGGAAEAMTALDSQATWYHAGANGKLTTIESTPAQPAEVMSSAEALTHLNRDAITEWEIAASETFWFPSFDGVRVQGWIYWPKSTSTNAKAPAILSIHGGPHGSFGFGFSPAFHYYASRGYATIAINPRGSSGYGQRFFFPMAAPATGAGATTKT